MLATLQASEKFDRFAHAVLLTKYSPERAKELKGKVEKFSQYWAEFAKNSTPKVLPGRARLDAFGLIFNRVAAIDLNLPENNREPNASVSYPFLWGSSWHDKVQWNGAAENANDVERLGRNVGEVLGVFAAA